MAEPKIVFEDGTLKTPGYVEIDGTRHQIVEAEYQGNTPLSAHNLNLMQKKILEDMGNKTEIAQDRQCIGNLLDTYNDTATYGVGDIVIEDSRLWKCIQDTVEAEEFNPEHWQKTSLKEMIGAVNSEVGDSGWIDITLLQNCTARSGNEYKPACRKVGKNVYLKGQITIPANTSGVLFYLPEGFRPAYEINPGSTIANNVQAWIVPETGAFTVKNVGNTALNYIPIQAVFAAEEVSNAFTDKGDCVKNTEYNDFKNNVYKKNEINNLFENIENNLGDLEEEQAEQNTDISNNTAEIAKLKQENEELASLMPWKTTEISESIHVEEAAKYSKNRLIPIGNLKQETRSGKNKFIPLPTGNNGGITITRNEDGTYNLTGTATTDVNHTAFVDLDKSELKNGVAYILSSTKNLPAGVSSRVEMYNGTSWLRAFISNISSTNSTSTGTANTTNVTRIRFGIFITAGTTVDIQNLGLQLEEGTVATDYEQYGVMPSVEFQSMPVVATGVQKIRKCGKNLWKFDCAKVTSSTQAWFFYDGRKGAYGKDLQDQTDQYIKLKAGFYAFSCIKTHNCALQIVDNNEKILITDFPKTIEVTKDTYIIPRFRNLEVNTEAYAEGLQIEKVTSIEDTATNYEPYHEEVLELNLKSKNTYDGKYEIGGYDTETGQKVSSTNQYRNVNYIEVQPNTSYIFSLNSIKITQYIRYFYYDKNKNLIDTGASNGAFITPANCYFVNWHSSALKTDYPDGLIKSMIEKGNVVTEYQEYYNIELAKITDANGNAVAQDRIVRRNVDGVWKWQIEKNVEEVTFDGTEAWRTSFVNTSANTIRFAKQLNNVSGNKSCNNLLRTRTVEAHTDTEYLYLPNGGTLYVNINKNRLSSETVEAFQELLSNNNLKVYYATLATKYTDCPAELSVQLDKLYELQLERGINNIFIESESGVTAELQLEYMQDINMLVEKRLKALEDALITNESEE